MRKHSPIDWPPILLRRWLLTAAAGLGFLLAGLAAFLAAEDRVLLTLSVLLAISTLLRCLFFYRMAAGQAYGSLEGVCIAVQRLPMRRQQSVRIFTPDGKEHTFTLDKQARLRVGNCYRIYFQQPPANLPDDGLFRYLQAQDIFLGLEDLGEYHAGGGAE